MFWPGQRASQQPAGRRTTARRLRATLAFLFLSPRNSCRRALELLGSQSRWATAARTRRAEKQPACHLRRHCAGMAGYAATAAACRGEGEGESTTRPVSTPSPARPTRSGRSQSRFSYEIFLRKPHKYCSYAAAKEKLATRRVAECSTRSSTHRSLGPSSLLSARCSLAAATAAPCRSATLSRLGLLGQVERGGERLVSAAGTHAFLVMTLLFLNEQIM